MISVLTFLFEVFTKETLEDGAEREVLKIHSFLAPYKVTVLPLMKKVHSEKTIEICNMLLKKFMTNYDNSLSIGKRYRRRFS